MNDSGTIRILAVDEPRYALAKNGGVVVGQDDLTLVGEASKAVAVTTTPGVGRIKV
jgi:hypothetical protein